MTPAAVLVIAFNRPEMLEKCLNQIPKDGRKIYISIDGPRNEFEKILVAKTTKIANSFKRRNPNLQIYTKYATLNNGCKHGVRTAIDWIFEFENSAIILEDDIRVSSRFFNYADWGLHEYQNCKNVWQINGFTPLLEPYCVDGLYWTKYAHIWGWATWIDRWSKYDRDLINYPQIPVQDLKAFESVQLSPSFIKEFNQMLDLCKGGYNTWDTQWLYSMWLNNGIAISPGTRLTGNVGFDSRATHTTKAGNLGRNLMPSYRAKKLPFVVHPKPPENLDRIHEIIEFGINTTNISIQFTRKIKTKIFLRTFVGFLSSFKSSLQILKEDKFSKR